MTSIAVYKGTAFAVLLSYLHRPDLFKKIYSSVTRAQAQSLFQRNNF